MAARCVYCRKRPVDAEWRPFCSERCKLLDLANWVDGRYTVPAGQPTPEDLPAEAGSHEDDRHDDER